MGLKNIAVLTQYVDNYYCADVIKGIKAYFEDKPVRLFFLETRWEKTEASDYEYQYWSASKLAGTKNIDAVIIITATFCSTYSSEALAELLKTFIHAPIISVAVDLPITNLFYTSADCLSGYRELINHLISKHGCKKIAFVAANKTKSSEAEERLKAYKTVLKENNIDFNPDLIISSDFNQDETINVLRTKYPAKESINFDSVVCVNDYTAFGTIYYLKELGFKIPEDIIVTGYDDCTTAQQMGLTSINQQVYQQGLEAARVALSVAEGKKNPRKTKVAVKTFFRKSCGCCEQKNQTPGSEEFSSTQQFVNFARNYTSFHSLLDKVQGAHTLSHMYNLLSRILIEADIRSFAICLYKTPFFVNKGQDYSLPKKASLTMHYNHSRMEMCVDENIQFNPNDSILPEGIFNEDPCCFIINSIFYGEKQYGYLLYRPGEKEFNLYSVYLKIVSNSIAQAYEYSEKLKENTSLEKKNKVLSINSQTDELTKVFNRRGFMHLGQKTIDLALQMEASGLVLFGDMDGLKTINDNYGHDAGDRAIKAEAEILSKCFRASDVIGRLGGDEFAIVASGMGMDKLNDIKEQIEAECKIWKAEAQSPFNLSISLGAVPFNKDEFVLENLIAKADSEQYADKRLRHSARKNNF